MATPPKSFYSYLEVDKESQHQHVYRLVLLVIILAFLVFVGWAYSVIFSSRSNSKVTTTAPPAKMTELTDAQRWTMLNKPSSIPPINPNMTDAQRSSLLNKPSKIPPLK